MKLFFPEKIIVEAAAAELPRTRSILERLEGANIVFVDDDFEARAQGESTDERFRQEKRNLAIAVKRGGLVKEFRRHASLKQDREYYLIHAANCPFDCSYCYLQCYYETATPTIFANTDDLFEQTEDALRNETGSSAYFHAGETADALALEHISGFAADAVEFFAGLDNVTLELRTKSANVETILPLPHAERTVVSWTLTPQKIVEEYEHDTASLDERLEAALRCQHAGYPIGLRLDPLIHHDGWQEGYRTLIEKIAQTLDPVRIHSIVLGGFRFPPRLREIIIDRFGRNELVLGEFVPSPDGKYRYFRHVREEMYRELIGLISEHFGERGISRTELSMEPDYIWRNVGLAG